MRQPRGEALTDAIVEGLIRPAGGSSCSRPAWVLLGTPATGTLAGGSSPALKAGMTRAAVARASKWLPRDRRMILARVGGDRQDRDGVEESTWCASATNC